MRVLVLQNKVDKIMDLTGELSSKYDSEIAKLQSFNDNKR